MSPFHLSVSMYPNSNQKVLFQLTERQPFVIHLEEAATQDWRKISPSTADWQANPVRCKSVQGKIHAPLSWERNTAIMMSSGWKMENVYSPLNPNKTYSKNLLQNPGCQHYLCYHLQILMTGEALPRRKCCPYIRRFGKDSKLTPKDKCWEFLVTSRSQTESLRRLWILQQDYNWVTN